MPSIGAIVSFSFRFCGEFGNDKSCSSQLLRLFRETVFASPLKNIAWMNECALEAKKVSQYYLSTRWISVLDSIFSGAMYGKESASRQERIPLKVDGNHYIFPNIFRAASTVTELIPDIQSCVEFLDRNEVINWAKISKSCGGFAILSYFVKLLSDPVVNSLNYVSYLFDILDVCRDIVVNGFHWECLFAMLFDVVEMCGVYCAASSLTGLVGVCSIVAAAAFLVKFGLKQWT